MKFGKMKIFVVSSMIVLCAGCTTPSTKDAKTISSTPIPASIPDGASEVESFFLTDIGVATLPDRKCGMVLWTVDANRPIPVLRYVSGGTGLISFNRVPFELLRLNVDGSGAFGIFEEQTFAAGEDIKVQVKIEMGQGFDGGVYLKRGVIRVERPDDPILVTPVAGIAGCRSS